MPGAKAPLQDNTENSTGKHRIQAGHLMHVGLTELYLQAVGAACAVAPQVPLLLQGTGQSGIGAAHAAVQNEATALLHNRASLLTK